MRAQSHSINTSWFDSTNLPITALPNNLQDPSLDEEVTLSPPEHAAPEASSSNPPSPRPPPFSSLYFPPVSALERIKASVTDTPEFSLATAPAPSFEETIAEDEVQSEAKTAPPEKGEKGESSGKNVDDGEPPPPYTEGSSPLDSFKYVMAAAGGPASIITQVQQTGPPINALGGG